LDNTVTLQILGRKFIFQTESGMPDAEQVVANFEDAVRKVKSKFADKQVNVDKETILVLTGLNIASEQYKFQKKVQDALNRMTEKSAVVLSELEKAIT
jgi:cell division protein ZapA (FtsZ GTPase activity inhibitor)